MHDRKWWHARTSACSRKIIFPSLIIIPRHPVPYIHPNHWDVSSNNLARANIGFLKNLHTLYLSLSLSLSLFLDCVQASTYVKEASRGCLSRKTSSRTPMCAHAATRLSRACRWSRAEPFVSPWKALSRYFRSVRVPVGRKERKEKEKKGENGLSTTYVHWRPPRERRECARVHEEDTDRI